MRQYKYILHKVDEVIFNAYEIKSEYLGLYRILFCLITFLFYGIPNYNWIANSPDFLFSPPDISLASIFSGFPNPLFFTFANILIVILYVILLFGWKKKLTSLLLFFTLLICQSFSFSFGKIDHNIIWLMIPLIMAFSGWGNSFSVDAILKQKSPQNAWAISLMALILGFAMFTASIPKLLSGWLSLDSQATLSHLVYNHLYWRRDTLLFDEVSQMNSPVFWEIFDYLTVIFEFGFLFAFLNSQIFRFFVLAAVLFHISVFLTFDIVFVMNLLTYLLFINWSIFDPLLRSSLFQSHIFKVFTPRNLAISIGTICLYAIYSIFLNKEFAVPSGLDITLNLLDIESTKRYVRVFILFTISLLIAFICAARFLQNRSFSWENGRLIRKEIV